MLGLIMQRVDFATSTMFDVTLTKIRDLGDFTHGGEPRYNYDRII